MKGPPPSACLVVVYARGVHRRLGKRVSLADHDSDFALDREVLRWLLLDGASVEGCHARLVKHEDAWSIVDASDGVSVNDLPVRARQLRNGDRIKVGGVIVKYLASPDVESEFMSTIAMMMVTDELTRLSNLRLLVEHASNEIRRAVRHEVPLALVVLDIDRFQQVNDAVGRNGGDALLVQVAAVLRARVPQDLTLARYGVDRFALLLGDTTEGDARGLARELCVLVKARPFEVGGVAIVVSVTAGVAVWSSAMRTPDALIAAAEAALHVAKIAARNGVV